MNTISGFLTNFDKSNQHALEQIYAYSRHVENSLHEGSWYFEGSIFLISPPYLSGRCCYSKQICLTRSNILTLFFSLKSPIVPAKASSGFRKASFLNWEWKIQYLNPCQLPCYSNGYFWGSHRLHRPDPPQKNCRWKSVKILSHAELRQKSIIRDVTRLGPTVTHIQPLKCRMRPFCPTLEIHELWYTTY